ncbi:MAG: DMT family transporter [Proteobacteria bacterium]|nr:DMT family transporter [Pseudomonadota bacterium]NOG59982.1 DMT family transporter [Pseudomonadota bacterium]
MQIDKRYLFHGFLPAFGSACCFAVMAMCIKIASSELPAPQLVFFRSLIGLLIIVPIVLPKGLTFIKTPVLHMHIFRGFISVCAMICFFYAIGHVGLSESTLLNATSPLFIGLMSMPILKEKVSVSTAIALIIGFIGVALILKPGTALFTLAALVGLCSGLFIASAKVLVRYMATTEPVLRTVFYFSITTTLYSGALMLWLWQTPNLFDISIMVLAGICATGGQTLLTYSFTHNDAVTVAPFTYVTVVVATLIGWIGWEELPDIGSSIGTILIISACISLSFQGKLPNPWKLKKPT